MSDQTRKLSITYSSGLIPPPEQMSTLAVFYDEIWLPYPCGSLMVEGFPTGSGTIRFPRINVSQEAGEAYEAQVNSIKLLSTANIVNFLPEPKRAFSELEYDITLIIIKEMLNLSFPNRHNQIEKLSLLEGINESFEFYKHNLYKAPEHLSLVAHALYGIKPAPCQR